jgi:tellurite resistance protein TerC
LQMFDPATQWLGAPITLWLIFAAVVIALLAFDLGVLHRKDRAISVRESLYLSAFYITAGLLFGLFVAFQRGTEAGTLYVTGFLVEKTLAMDNVFIIAMIFSWLAIPREYQHRVLFWGILGVVILRGIMIGAGAALVSNFSWILLIFAVFLVFTGIKILLTSGSDDQPKESAALSWLRSKLPVTEQLHGNAFFVRQQISRDGPAKLFVTPLFVALIAIELADLVFAVDSIPAIFAITTDPFIVYTSNIFAILGLRALYFALAATMHRFRYLKFSLAAVLIFIGGKVIVADLAGVEKIHPFISLTVTVALLAAGVLYSLCRTAKEERIDAGNADTEAISKPVHIGQHLNKEGNT